jgi:hypothetical protein
MIDYLDLIADILIKYYPPIGNIQHKYVTKVTAIGLLKSANLMKPEYSLPYYERLKSYKGLVQNLMDNFKMTNIVALKIFAEIICAIIGDERTRPEERYKSPSFLSLTQLLNPGLGDRDSAGLLNQSRQLFGALSDTDRCERAAAAIIDQYLQDQARYDELARKIVKKCLTEVTQESVLHSLETATYVFFVYAYFDVRLRQLRFEICYRHKKNIEQLEPFFNVKMLSRSIISLVNSERTVVNFFGERIQNYDEIRAFFAKNPNITVMFF